MENVLKNGVNWWWYAELTYIACEAGLDVSMCVVYVKEASEKRPFVVQLFNGFFMVASH